VDNKSSPSAENCAHQYKRNRKIAAIYQDVRLGTALEQSDNRDAGRNPAETRQRARGHAPSAEPNPSEQNRRIPHSTDDNVDNAAAKTASQLIW